MSRIILNLVWFLAVSCCFLPDPLAAQEPIPRGLELPPALNFAISPNPVGSGARAIGWGTAFIAVADDATAASHNPGGLVQLERPEISIVGSYFFRHDDQDVNRADTVIEDQNLDSIELNYLSVVYPFRLWHRNVTVSLNFQRLFNMEGDSDVASLLNPRECACAAVQRVSSRQTGQLFTISPAVAVQITPTFSVGVALNIWPDLFDNGWEQKVDVEAEGTISSGPRIVPFTSRGRIDEEFDFEGVNATIGFLWTINSIFTVGGVVRTPFTAKVRHKHKSELTVILEDGSEPVSIADSFTETLDMDMPLSYGLGVAAVISDSLTVALDVSRVHWSDFELEESRQADTVEVENATPSGKGAAVLNGDGDDITSVRLGAEYQWILPRIAVPFRAGVFYDPEPGDGGTDDFFGFSLGAGLVTGKVVLDMAYTFRTGTIKSEANDTDVYQHTLISSLIYHF